MSDANPFLKAIGAVASRAEDAASFVEKGSYTPPDDVRSNARRGLELRRKYGRGGLTNSEASDQGIGSGVQRASNLANGKALSLDTIRRMHAFFERHEKNKDTPPEEGNGKIAWLLWGGDAGRRWADGILKREGILKRLGDLQERLVKAAKRTGPRIPGDGDGDGIAYEGRDKGGRKLGKPALDALLRQHKGMGLVDEAHARVILRAAQRGDMAAVQARAMEGAAGKAFKDAVLSQMKANSGAQKPAAAAPSKPASAKPAAAAPSKPASAKPAAAAPSKPASAKPAAAKAPAGDAHAASALAVTAREKEALLNYTGAMFRTLNPRLRAGKGAGREDKADLAAMDAAFAKASTKADMTVYRGIGGDMVSKLVKGAFFTDGGFTSTTSKADIADSFARGDSGEAILEIRVPKGSKAISLRDMSQFGKAEQEVLLNRGGTFRVLDRVEAARGKPARIVMEYLG